MTDLTAQTIDENRPWITDTRDDPASMSWPGTLLNPFGYSSKLHFSRAWSAIFIARVLSFVIPLGAIMVVMMAGGNPQALFVGFIPFGLIFFFTLFQSLCIHIRRLADGRRPVVFAALVFLPITMFFVGLSLTAYPAIGSDGFSQFFADQRAASEQAKAGEASDAETARVEEAAPVDPAVAKAEKAAKRERQAKNQQIMAGAMRNGVAGWLLSAIGVATFSLVYVARIPNGGQGPFSTGGVTHRGATRRDYELG